MFVKKVFPDTASASDTGELCIGGMTSTDLVEQFDTPLYVLDQKTIEARCESFVDAFTGLHSNTDVVYASKAYINASLASVITSKNMGFDVVSGGELAIIAASGADLSRVYFHGNNKTEDELTYAVRLGIGRIVVDSFYELELLNKVAKDLNVVQGVLLRISPAVDPHTHVYTTTGILDSKFGFAIDTGDAEEAILEAIESSNIDLKGVHFHLGSPIFEIEPYEVAVDLVLRFVHRFSDKFTLEEFSPGGGFAIAYTRNDNPPQIQEYAEAIVTTMRNTCSDLKMDLPKLIIEPGRSIIGPAGVALYTVGAIKDIPGVRKYVSVDGGMGDNIRPALYQSEYEVVSACKLNDEDFDTVTIAGKYCESGDLLAKDVLIPNPESGDIIAIPAAGAYCPSMSSNYNMNPRPPIVLVNDGQARVIRRRETYEDLMIFDR
ncbi:MAG: diaminopimelate decarboxylase [SAR202 cluster bacterium]|nr:diaminopimelate decarboxylase [SAR202 cluster bacterium]MQG26092.1 diaminopimelate decarboxylase [SAR202 cluster bacterium]MQG52152.1 diaminopimelate decarboxylase [SAR202 cluster bacterium]|tara:strand:- start:217 stop:1518 length:1302 start_codon:yes stop_codon:yes gene_type:complete